MIDRFCAFSSLARSNIEYCDSLDFIASLFVENMVLKPQFISRSTFDFISMGDLARSSLYLTSSVFMYLIPSEDPFQVLKEGWLLRVKILC